MGAAPGETGGRRADACSGAGCSAMAADVDVDADAALVMSTEAADAMAAVLPGRLAPASLAAEEEPPFRCSCR